MKIKKLMEIIKDAGDDLVDLEVSVDTGQKEFQRFFGDELLDYQIIDCGKTLVLSFYGYDNLEGGLKK